MVHGTCYSVDKRTIGSDDGTKFLNLDEESKMRLYTQSSALSFEFLKL